MIQQSRASVPSLCGGPAGPSFDQTCFVRTHGGGIKAAAAEVVGGIHGQNGLPQGSYRVTSTPEVPLLLSTDAARPVPCEALKASSINFGSSCCCCDIDRSSSLEMFVSGMIGPTTKVGHVCAAG